MRPLLKPRTNYIHLKSFAKARQNQELLIKSLQIEASFKQTSIQEVKPCGKSGMKSKKWIEEISYLVMLMYFYVTHYDI